MNRFSHYIRDIIDWYVWKLKILKLNEHYDKCYRAPPYHIWINRLGFSRYNFRDLASYRHCDSDDVNVDGFLPFKHDERKAAPFFPIILNIRRLDTGKFYRDVVLPVKYRYSSGYEHPHAYKSTSRHELASYQYKFV